MEPITIAFAAAILIFILMIFAVAFWVNIMRVHGTSKWEGGFGGYWGGDLGGGSAGGSRDHSDNGPGDDAGGGDGGGDGGGGGGD